MEEAEEIQKELLQSWEITENILVSKEALLEAIAFRVGKLLEANPDQLFSKLYRLDISEANIKKAMIDEAGFSFIIAHLIYNRQLEKFISRKENKSHHPDDDLAW